MWEICLLFYHLDWKKNEHDLFFLQNERIRVAVLEFKMFTSLPLDVSKCAYVKLIWHPGHVDNVEKKVS